MTIRKVIALYGAAAATSQMRSCTRSAPCQRSMPSVPATWIVLAAVLDQRVAELAAGGAERDA